MVEIIEARSVERDYGFAGTQAIIQHSKCGRLLIEDGFGGVDSLAGGAVRWRHGLLIAIHPGDTFASLDQPWNEFFSNLQSAEHANDPQRPILSWDGSAIERLAESAGL